MKILDLLQALDRGGFRYMIVGGMAAVLYGAASTTQDLDISLSMNAEDLQNLRDCLKDFHPVHRMTPQKFSFTDHPESFAGISNIHLRTDLGVLDVIGDLSLIGDFEKLYGRAESFDIGIQKIKALALDDLIELKKKLGREKDLIVLKELEAIRSQRKR